MSEISARHRRSRSWRQLAFATPQAHARRIVMAKPSFALLVEPGPFGRSVMSYGASRRLAHELCIFRERSCPVAWRPLLPGRTPSGKFTLIDAQIHAPRRGIDLDPIAVAHQRQRSADKGLRRDIANAHPARRAGEATVGDQRDLLAHALSVDQRGHAE